MSEYGEFIIKVSHADLIAGSPFGTPYFHGEIVRCRDCDHGLFGGKTCDRLDPGFDEYWFEVEPDGYCAWGERQQP